MSLQGEEPAIDDPVPHPTERSNTPQTIFNASESSPIAIDPVLLQQAHTYTTKRGALDSPEEEGREEGGKKRVRLSTDLEKAHLIRLCINNFGRYGEGREKFFQSIGQLYEKEVGVKALGVKCWIIRRENERMKEVEEAKGSSGRAVAESEWGQAMDTWLTLVRGYEELGKEKKAKAAGEKGQNRPVAKLRERMSQTIRERRAAEREDSTASEISSVMPLESPQQSEPTSTIRVAGKDRRSGNNSVKGDQAFASQRRTFDRILESLSAGDEAMIKRIGELEQNRIDRLEAVERDKLAALEKALGAQDKGASEEVGRLESRFEALEARVAVQGQRTEAKLDMLMAMLQQPLDRWFQVLAGMSACVFRR